MTTIDTKLEYIKSLDKTFSMIYQAIGEKEFRKMIEVMIRTAESKISLLERNEMEIYKKNNSNIVVDERVKVERK